VWVNRARARGRRGWQGKFGLCKLHHRHVCDGGVVLCYVGSEETGVVFSSAVSVLAGFAFMGTFTARQRCNMCLRSPITTTLQHDI